MTEGESKIEGGPREYSLEKAFRQCTYLPEDFSKEAPIDKGLSAVVSWLGETPAMDDAIEQQVEEKHLEHSAKSVGVLLLHYANYYRSELRYDDPELIEERRKHFQRKPERRNKADLGKELYTTKRVAIGRVGIFLGLGPEMKALEMLLEKSAAVTAYSSDKVIEGKLLEPGH